MIYQKVAGIYAVSLKRDGKSILPYRSDEENLPGTITKTDSPVTVRIDFEGASQTVLRHFLLKRETTEICPSINRHCTI